MPSFRIGRGIRRSAACAAVAAALAGGRTRAADTWTNAAGTGAWTTNANWLDTTAPDPTDAVIFPAPGPAGHDVAIPAAATARAWSVQFDSSYTLTGGTLRVEGAPIGVAAGATATIASALVSDTGLVKTGAGTLALAGNNFGVLAGQLRISDGTVRAATNVALGSGSNIWLGGTLEIDGDVVMGREIRVAGGGIRVTAGHTLTLNSTIAWAGGATADELTKGGPGTLIVNGQSARAGVTRLDGGTTRLTKSNALGGGAIALGSGATLEIAAGSSNGAGGLSMAHETTIRGSGATATVAAPALISNAPNAAVRLETGTSATDRLLVAVGGGSPSSTITTSGAGTVELTGAGNYAGRWLVDAGVLQVNGNAALGAGGTSAAAPGGRIDFDGGTLRAAAGFDTFRRVEASGDAFIDTAAHTVRLLGDVRGDGIVRKRGSGTLVAANLSGPAVDVAAGELAIAGDAAVAALSLGPAATLNVDDNVLRIAAGGADLGTWTGAAYTGVAGMIARGFNNGAWNGAGGIMTRQRDAQFGLTLIGAAPAEDDSGDVIVKYTWAGDANLDGFVDGGDYAFIDAFVGSTGSNVSYLHGDFNYDGFIDGGDYAYIDPNVGRTPPIGQQQAAAAVPVAVVPEPTALLILLPAVPLLLARRRPRGCGTC